MSYGHDVKFTFYGKLSEERGQIRIVSEATGAITPGRGGIVQAPCGTGKTVMGLFCASRWRKTTLVLVHTEFLAEQWEKAARDFLKLQPHEIGRVQGDVCEFKGKKLVIAMVESISAKARGKSEDYPKAFYDWPGIVILDEVHRHAAETWHLAIGKFPAAYRLGLSATPERKDGMTQVILWHVGPIVSRTELYRVSPVVFTVEFESYIPEGSYKQWGKRGMTDDINMGRLVNALAKDGARNAMIAFYVAQALDAGRKVIVLSDRLKQIDTLMDLVKRKVAKDGIRLGKYIGSMKTEARAVSAECHGIFGTYALAAEGLDLPALDTLVMATPRSSVEQSIGRILREHAGKKQPIVVDPIDALPICRVIARKRVRFYEEQGWDVEIKRWSD